MTHSIDSGAGQLYPMFDESSGLCYVVGKGDTMVRCYEVGFGGGADGSAIIPTCQKSSDFQSSRGQPFAGVCMLPKSTCNVRNVEMARMLKLTNDSVVPISYVVPRAENLKAYFQDDLYLPARHFPLCDDSDASGQIHRWFNNEEDVVPLFKPLKPADMETVSQYKANLEASPAARPASMSKISSFQQEISNREKEAQKKEDSFNKLQQMALQRAQYHPNASGGGHGFKVDAAPIHDDDDSDAGWSDSD